MYVDMFVIEVFIAVSMIVGIVICVKLTTLSERIWGKDSHKPAIFFWVLTMYYILVNDYVEEQQFDLVDTFIIGVGVPIIYSTLRIIYLKFRSRN